MLRQFLPNKLCPSGGMVHLALESLRIDKLIFILIDQTDSRLEIGLKLIAVLSQIMD